MPSVRIKDNEPFDMALRRFRRTCEKAGVFSEMRKREHYEKPTSIRKRKAAAAVKRQERRSMRKVGPRRVLVKPVIRAEDRDDKKRRGPRRY